MRLALDPFKEQQKHRAEDPLFSVIQPCLAPLGFLITAGHHRGVGIFKPLAWIRITEIAGLPFIKFTLSTRYKGCYHFTLLLIFFLVTCNLSLWSSRYLIFNMRRHPLLVTGMQTHVSQGSTGVKRINYYAIECLNFFINIRCFVNSTPAFPIKFKP